jgi:hypothetical protein
MTRWKPASEVPAATYAPGMFCVTYLVTYEDERGKRHTTCAYRDFDDWDGPRWREVDREDDVVRGTVISVLEIEPDAETPTPKN